MKEKRNISRPLGRIIYPLSTSPLEHLSRGEFFHDKENLI